jgi:hypothetical protein
MAVLTLLVVGTPAAVLLLIGLGARRLPATH